MSLRLLPALVCCGILALALTACTPTVNIPAAADAEATQCADVVVRLPEKVADQPRRETDAQGTGAWGDPSAVILRCGVATPGPTTQECVSVNDVDWIVDDSEAPKYYLFTTYGRTPAVEVKLDYDVVGGATTLADLSQAVSVIPAAKQCTDISDVQ